MKLFKNKKSIAGQKAGDIAAGWIAAGIEKIQCKWADAMAVIFSKMSSGWIKAVTISCVLLMAGISTTLVVSGFGRPVKMFKIPSEMTKPLPLLQPPRYNPAIPEGLLKRIEKFRRYLDSLSTTPAGRHERDSLMRVRPGLMDSLKRIEAVYCRK
jgi:hypothetical protein